MSGNITQTILDNVHRYSKTPGDVSQIALDALEAVIAGVDIVDGTSPFVFLLEGSATLTAAAINEGEILARRMYPKLAQNADDLYYHMSDTDFIDRFAVASKSTIKVLIPTNELLKNAIALSTVSSTRTVILPSDTKFMVNNVTYGIFYPIVIDVMVDGSIAVKYDGTHQHPLKPLMSNVIPNRIITAFDTSYLELTVAVEQFDTKSTIYTIDNTGDFKTDIPFVNKFLYARVYQDTGNNEWIEISTTHNELIHDVNAITAVLSVIGNAVSVRIPDIYQVNNLIGANLRVDVYTTLGAYTDDLSVINASKFSAVWNTLDTFAVRTPYLPLDKMSDMIIFSTDTVVGGSDGRTFEQLRQRVVYHKYAQTVPIRPTDIVVDLEQLDYHVDKVIESITRRVYLAIKGLPTRTDNALTLSGIVVNNTITVDPSLSTIQGGYGNSISKHANGNISVNHNALYRMGPTGIVMLSDIERSDIEGLGDNELITLLNGGQYFYSPFDYVIDTVLGAVSGRAYYLSNPVIDSRRLESVNSGLSFNIGTSNTTVSFTNDVYVITVTATIPTGMSGVHAQLRYNNVNNDVASYAMPTNTVINNNSAVFTFELSTQYDISDLGVIEMDGLVNSLGIATTTSIGISDSFDIFYVVEGSKIGNTSTFDNHYNNNLFNTEVISVTWDSLVITFGSDLTNLYSPSRMTVKSPVYATHPVDVPALYTEVEYVRGPNGIDYTIDVNGNVVLTVLHAVGDPVLDVNGNPVLSATAGDFILSGTGERVLVSGSTYEPLYQLGMVLVNAMYRYGNTANVVSYGSSIPKAIVNNLNNDIIPVAGNLHELTELYYSPRGSVNKIEVDVGTNAIVSVDPLLVLRVIIYVDSTTYNTASLKDNFITLFRELLSVEINNITFSPSNLIGQLISASSGHIKGATINDANGNAINTMKVVNKNDSFNVVERMVLTKDGLLDISSDITIEFKRIDN